MERVKITSDLVPASQKCRRKIEVDMTLGGKINALSQPTSCWMWDSFGASTVTEMIHGKDTCHSVTVGRTE